MEKYEFSTGCSLHKCMYLFKTEVPKACTDAIDIERFKRKKLTGLTPSPFWCPAPPAPTPPLSFWRSSDKTPVYIDWLAH